jgi:hypothetical protein
VDGKETSEILSKISSYNIFNYLFPGTIFALLANSFLNYRVELERDRDIFIAGFVCYFAGLVISRFGSLVLEPLLKRLSFIKFADYKDFVLASQRDKQLEVLSEVNNTYRTLSSLFALLLILKLYIRFGARYPFIRDWDMGILIVLLLVMFLLSYRKQTAYISKRVKANGDL